MMKALRFHGSRDLRIDEIEEPGAPEAGQVLVKVLYCGICGSDLHEYTDGPILIPEAFNAATGAGVPQILGHEFSAVVEAVGDGVTTVKKGDRVSIVPHINKQGEYYSRRNLGHVSSETTLVGFSWPWGGMGERAVLPEQNVVSLPDDVTDEQGAMVEPASVALNAVDLGGITPGGTVLVAGAGPIGALVAMAAAASGATRVFVFEPNEGRRKRAASIPSVEVYGTLEELRNALRDGTESGLGVDVAFECAGNENALAMCIDEVRRLGTVVQVGLFVKTPRVDMFKVSEKALRIVGSWGFPITIGPRVVNLIASGKMPVELLIHGKTNLLEAVDEGFDRLLAPGSDMLKVLIRVA